MRLLHVENLHIFTGFLVSNSIKIFQRFATLEEEVKFNYITVIALRQRGTEDKHFKTNHSFSSI
jgi:hypothetical protein